MKIQIKIFFLIYYPIFNTESDIFNFSRDLKISIDWRIELNKQIWNYKTLNGSNSVLKFQFFPTLKFSNIKFLVSNYYCGFQFETVQFLKFESEIIKFAKNEINLMFQPEIWNSQKFN